MSSGSQQNMASLQSLLFTTIKYFWHGVGINPTDESIADTLGALLVTSAQIASVHSDHDKCIRLMHDYIVNPELRTLMTSMREQFQNRLKKEGL